LGAGQPKAARLAVRVVLVMAIAEGLLNALVMILLRNIWGHVYTHEQEVVKYVAIMMPIVAISSFLDGIQGVLSGLFLLNSNNIVIFDVKFYFMLLTF
jgi:MATE family multidrug resistance protein